MKEQREEFQKVQTRFPMPTVPLLPAPQRIPLLPAPRRTLHAPFRRWHKHQYRVSVTPERSISVATCGIAQISYTTKPFLTTLDFRRNQ